MCYAFYIGIVSECKQATELFKLEKEKLEEEVENLEGLSRNKDERISECEAIIEHKERECAIAFLGKTINFLSHLTLRNGRGNHWFETAPGVRREAIFY